VEARRPRFESSREKREEIVQRFLEAAGEGDTDGLLELLAEEVVLYGDGGGKAPALAQPLHGADRVSRALVNWMRAGVRVGARYEPVWVNGQPGVRFLSPDGRLINVIAVDVLDGRVQAVRSVVNPDKLGHLGPLADIPALLGKAGT
jgi:RNA polymerase sigma-70 factor (ECF subfamily)